ncbi:hypothetical protein HX866_18825 [Pseudomonas gingeri]|uniref:hypothetical protein n=1 Tax=Pseudomonas gingeri TaxID=117681 RepID=UPI0015A1C56A|nr:hypothetical protein [Pseudomonas gingeri]NWA26943.1 hypothetical protein [Pseudomonas gingeri]
MHSNQAVSQALQIRFAAFERHDKDDYESEDIAHGAALLALDVGIITNDSLLIAQAQEVLASINRSRQLEDEQDAQCMADSYAAMDASQEKHKQAFAMVKELVGKEFHDPRWSALIEIYQEAFPTFLVRDSVYARIGPKQAVNRLRHELVKLVTNKRLDRAPMLGEVHALLPDAKALLESRTVDYLERALPGFDFRGHPILSPNKVPGTL